MPETLLKEKMKAMGLVLVKRFVSPVNDQAVVLHYRDTKRL